MEILIIVSQRGYDNGYGISQANDIYNGYGDAGHMSAPLLATVDVGDKPWNKKFGFSVGYNIFTTILLLEYDAKQQYGSVETAPNQRISI